MDGWDGTRRGRCVSSEDEEIESPVAVGVPMGVGGALQSGGGGLGLGHGRVGHADSFVRSTRTDDVDPSDDDQGSPRSRRLTFEFRNFNLFPDVSDGQPSPGLLQKRRPSSLDIQRVEEEPEREYAGYLTSPGYSTVGPSGGAYFPYGFTHLTTQSPPLLPTVPIQPRPTELSLISTSPTFAIHHHPYRSIQSTRPGPTANPRRNSDVGPAPSAHREKRVVTLREPVPVPIRTAVAHSTHDEDGSSELSEMEDADGPSKSGDSSVTSSRTRRKPTHRTRKKKPYKSRRCDICNKTFTKECDVTRHRRTAHGEDEIEFKCHECGRLFNRKDALERHYKVYEGTPHVARRYQPKTYLGGKK